jgi:hypothetical protein
MEEITEHLMAKMQDIIDSFVVNMRAEIKAAHEKMMVIIKAGLEEMEAAMETNKGEVNATDFASNPKEKEAVEKHQDVLNEEAAMETIGTLEDRYGDRHLAVGCCRQPKKRTHGYDGSWKNLAAARRRITRRESQS